MGAADSGQCQRGAGSRADGAAAGHGGKLFRTGGRASVSGLRGWSLTEETDGTVTIDHAAAQSTAETTD